MKVPLGPGGEFDLIRKLVGSHRPLPSSILVGPGDDCAVLEGGLVVSVDLTVEDVHFRRDWISLEEAGFRATVAALSDLAAMAADPLGILASLAVESGQAAETAEALNAGVADAAEEMGVPILGGDLARSPGPVVLDLVALGRSPEPLLRSGSLPGDEVWVTGWLGGSSAAVSAWRQGEEPDVGLKRAFSRPTPRIREALWLAERTTLHAGIDISDGLAGDAGHLAAASRVALILVPEALPFSPALVARHGDGEEARHYALYGGEDYELCLTAAPGALAPLRRSFEGTFGIPLSLVGRVEEGEGVRVEGDTGTDLQGLGGFSHFKGGGGG